MFLISLCLSFEAWISSAAVSSATVWVRGLTAYRRVKLTANFRCPSLNCGCEVPPSHSFCLTPYVAFFDRDSARGIISDYQKVSSSSSNPTSGFFSLWLLIPLLRTGTFLQMIHSIVTTAIVISGVCMFFFCCLKPLLKFVTDERKLFPAEVSKGEKTRKAESFRERQKNEYFGRGLLFSLMCCLFIPAWCVCVDSWCVNLATMYKVNNLQKKKTHHYCAFN